MSVKEFEFCCNENATVSSEPNMPKVCICVIVLTSNCGGKTTLIPQSSFKGTGELNRICILFISWTTPAIELSTLSSTVMAAEVIVAGELILSVGVALSIAPAEELRVLMVNPKMVAVERGFLKPDTLKATSVPAGTALETAFVTWRT